MRVINVLVKGALVLAFFSLCAKLFTRSNMANVLFIEEAAARGIAEIEAGKLALEKSTSPAVKELAQQMIIDHTAANKELMALVQRKKIAISDESALLHQAQTFFLHYDENKSFDIAYAHHQLNAHKDVINLFRSAAKSQDVDISQFAVQLLPALEHHLTMIRQLITHIAESHRPASQPMRDLNEGHLH